MDNALTLEEEISQRRQTVENALNCINSFLDSVTFYIKKLYLYPSQDPQTCGQDLNLKLFEFVEAEAMRAVEKAAQITLISSNTLLPVTYVDPYSVIFLAVSNLMALQYEKWDAIEEVRLIHLCSTIRSKASDLRLKPVKRSRAEIIELFQNMKDRYYQDHHEALECYRGEYDNLKGDLHDLHDTFQDCHAVSLYKQCERCIVKTLSAMEEAHCTESDLLKLLAYIVRFEILHETASKIRQHECGEYIPSDKQVFDALIQVKYRITNQRLWYAIYRPLVQVNKIQEGNFEQFEQYISRLLKDCSVTMSIRDLRSKVDVGSFLKDVNEWKDDGIVPVSGKNFETYKQLGMDFLKLLLDKKFS